VLCSGCILAPAELLGYGDATLATAEADAQRERAEGAESDLVRLRADLEATQQALRGRPCTTACAGSDQRQGQGDDGSEAMSVKDELLWAIENYSGAVERNGGTSGTRAMLDPLRELHQAVATMPTPRATGIEPRHADDLPAHPSEHDGDGAVRRGMDSKALRKKATEKASKWAGNGDVGTRRTARERQDRATNCETNAGLLQPTGANSARVSWL